MPTKRENVTAICTYCGTRMEPTIIHQDVQQIIRGWRCPKCGFTLIHPKDVSKAIDTIKETVRI